MLFEDLSEKIIACCFEVSNELGCGFLESVYEKALLLIMNEKGFSAQAQVPLNVEFHGQNIGKFFADIIVEGKILIELKAVSQLAPEHVGQVLNYLKTSGLPVGLLVNFGKPKLEIRRINNRFGSDPFHPIHP